MLNVLIAGVGGQGSVLAAKILAQAAADAGWQVRSAETIGMAQRGGSVVSHVRMGNLGEAVHAPLVPRGQAHCIVALEPGEGLRALPYLAPDGLVVSAQTGIASVTADLTGNAYNPQDALAALQQSAPHFATIDDAAVIAAAGSGKAINVALLAKAVFDSAINGYGLVGAITIDQLKAALRVCVKPQLVAMNEQAIDAAIVG